MTQQGPHGSKLTALRLANLRAAPRCSAWTRKGTFCQAAAIRGRQRCRCHGGCSTGPKSKAGRGRCRQVRWKTDYHSAKAKKERRQLRELLQSARETIA